MANIDLLAYIGGCWKLLDVYCQAVGSSAQERPFGDRPLGYLNYAGQST